MGIRLRSWRRRTGEEGKIPHRLRKELRFEDRTIYGPWSSILPTGLKDSQLTLRTIHFKLQLLYNIEAKKPIDVIFSEVIEVKSAYL